MPKFRLTHSKATSQVAEAAVHNALSRGKAAAQATAEAIATRLRNRIRDGVCNSWEDFERLSNLIVDPVFRSRGYSSAVANEYLDFYVSTAASVWERKQREIQTNPISISMVSAPKADAIIHHEIKQDAGGFKLRPQQRKAVDATINALWEAKTTNAVLMPLKTGAGKTVIGSAICKYLQDNNYLDAPGLFAFGHIFIFAPKAVVIPWIRTLKRIGVKGVGTDVLVLPHDALRSKNWEFLFYDEEIEFFNNKKIVKRCRLPEGPVFVILDEYHKYKKSGSKKSRYIEAFLDYPETKWLDLSATPGITVNDMRLFTLQTRHRQSDGTLIDAEQWPVFSWTFCRNSRPDQNIGANMERFRDYMSFAIVDPPNDPMKVKAYNRVKFFKFKTEEEWAKYWKLEKAYVEALKRCGENISERGLVMAQFQIYRNGSELLSVPYFVEAAIQAYRDGFAPVLALCYQNSVIDAAAAFIKAGFRREDISIIWGGQKEIKESDIYSHDEFFNLLMKKEAIDEGRLPADAISKKEWTKFRKTLAYNRDRIRREETEDEKRERMKWMSTLKLHAQTADERQDAVDDFIQGRTKICIYTFAAGGVGLSLDHQVEGGRPRQVFSTVCYYAEEYIQALGRCLRVVTLSDVIQNIMVPRGTIVEHHVVPRLLPKLRSISKIATQGDDMVGAMEKSILKQEKQVSDIPDAEQAIESEDDAGDLAELAQEQDIDDDDDDDDSNNGK